MMVQVIKLKNIFLLIKWKCHSVLSAIHDANLANVFSSKHFLGTLSLGYIASRNHALCKYWEYNHIL